MELVLELHSELIHQIGSLMAKIISDHYFISLDQREQSHLDCSLEIIETLGLESSFLMIEHILQSLSGWIVAAGVIMSRPAFSSHFLSKSRSDMDRHIHTAMDLFRRLAHMDTISGKTIRFHQSVSRQDFSHF